MRYTLLTLFLILTYSLSAQQSAQVKELESQRKKLLAEIELTDKLLKENNRTTQVSMNRLNLLAQQLVSRRKMINLLNDEIRGIDREMNEKNKEIAALEKELNEKKQNYSKSVQGMYKRHSSQDKLLFILSAESFSQSMRRLRYLHEYAGWQKRQAAEIVTKQKEIQLKKEELEKTKTEKQSLLAERESESKKLVTEENTQKVEVDNLKKKQKELQAELKKQKQRADAMQKQIQKYIAEEIARAQKESKKQNSEKRHTDTKGGYAMTQNEKQLSDNFANNRGRLPSPVNGQYVIVANFGLQTHLTNKSAQVNNNHIKMQTSSGSEALAVFNGEVVAIFKDGVMGVIVRHGNYFTTYHNLSNVYVKKGDVVKTGQPLGEIYVDADNNNNKILEFAVYKDMQALNPAQWISR